MATSFTRTRAPTAVRSAPNPAAGHRRPTPLPETPGHSLASLGQSLVGSLLLSAGSWCTQGFVCALQESGKSVPSKSLCKFWQLYGGVNGDLLQEGLCHTQACCTQSPSPCSRPLLTCTSAGDTQTPLWLSLYGVSGSWCTKGLFESSECLWRVWGLILTQFCPSYHLAGAYSLPLNMGYLLKVTPVPYSHHSNVGLKLNIQKTKITAPGPITSWQIDGETTETVTHFIFLGSKVTADGDCSHETKRRSLEGKL